MELQMQCCFPFRTTTTSMLPLCCYQVIKYKDIEVFLLEF
jgi:hypothetical protein